MKPNQYVKCLQAAGAKARAQTCPHPAADHGRLHGPPLHRGAGSGIALPLSPWVLLA